MDVLYNSHHCIVPSRGVLEWETSKRYLEDMKEFALPGTRFLKSLEEATSSLQELPRHLKSPFACAKRMHHVATSSNEQLTRDYLSYVLTDLRRWCVISQPEIQPFKESKRVVTQRDDPDPFAQIVWSAAESKGLSLGWFRLDLVIIEEKWYLNEVTRFNPWLQHKEARSVADATAQLMLEAVESNTYNKFNPSQVSIDDFIFNCERKNNKPRKRACTIKPTFL